MSDTPFLGEIRLVSFNFAPSGWAQCNGQLLPINANQPLFSLLGTAYGGDGRVNFALPDLRGRVAMSFGPDHPTVGEKAGESSHVVTSGELPAHTHRMQALAERGTLANPSGSLLASAHNLYGPPGDLTTLLPSSISSVGGSQAHENRQPFLTMLYCIAIMGLFPSQT